jgi:hypothetical protein
VKAQAKPKPKPEPKPAARTPKKIATTPARVPAAPVAATPPRDASRLGLPLARLTPVAGDERTWSAALLVAAALLLVASGAGSLTIGVTARRIARGGIA